MKTKTNRLLSLLLALCLCFGLATVAFAADTDETVAKIDLKVSTTGASSAMTVTLTASTAVTEKQAEAAAALGADALNAKQFVCTLKDSAGFIAANADAIKAANVEINSSVFEKKSVKVEDGAVVVVCALKANVISKTAKAADIKAALNGQKTTLTATLKDLAVKKSVVSTLTATVQADTTLVAQGTTDAVLYGNMPFVDVPSDKDYYNAVVWAINKDPYVTNGMDATHFCPDVKCTRAQVLTMLWRADGCHKAAKANNPFTDVKAGAYYYDAVLWAVEKGIAKGMTATTFEPDTTCTRAHVVTFLWRYEGSKTVKIDNPFTDVPAGQYYTDAVLWAFDYGVTDGMTPTTFCPNNDCLRAHVVTFICRDFAR